MSFFVAIGFANGQNNMTTLEALDSLISLRDSSNSKAISLKVIEELKKLPAESDSLKAVFKVEISTSFYDLKNYDSAKWYLQDILSIISQSNYDLLLIQVYDRLGVVISDLGDNSEAIENYQKALEIAETREVEEYQIWVAKINGNIGGIYYDFEDYGKALEYAKKANRIVVDNNLKGQYGVYQMQMGLSNLGLKNYPEAAEQLQNSVTFFEENFNPLFLQYGYINVSRVYIELNDLDQAEETLQKTRALTDSISSLAESATISALLAEVNYKRKEFRKAKHHADRSLEVSLKHKMKIKEMQDFEILYKIDSAEANYRSAPDFRAPLKTLFGLSESRKCPIKAGVLQHSPTMVKVVQR